MKATIHTNEHGDRYFDVSGQPDENNEPETPDSIDIRTTDTGNARRLINRHGADIRYVAQWKSWYMWNGRYWERDLTGQIMRRAQETVKGIYAEAALAGDDRTRKELARWAMQSESESHLRAMVNLARVQSEVAVTPNDFDAKPWLLNCRNATIDLRTGVAVEHDRADMLTTALDFDYDPDAKCPVFLSFLDKIMDGNASLITFLQRAIGYSLTADIREECIFVAWGGGSNGKSTLLNVIRSLTGSYSRAMSPDTLAASNHRNGSGPSSDIARLKGSRFISAIETDEGRRLNESLIKQLTSREPITARFLNQEDFEFAPTWKLWLATNHKPTIRGTDKGIWRRIRLIPFTVTFEEGEKDEGMPSKLHAELSGILNWAIQGCLTWQREGLGIPDEVKEATDEYRAEMDTLGAFLGECCVQQGGTWMKCSDLYDEYKDWCDENREFVIKSREFTKRLKERGIVQDRGTGEWSPVSSVNSEAPAW